jgi:outer membrane protein assembly factor BamB
MSEAVTQLQPDPFHPPATSAGTAPAVPALEATRPRLWPGGVILALTWGVIVIPSYVPGVQGTPLQAMAGYFGGMIGALCFALWWLLLSRVHWTDRLLVFLFFVLSGLATAAVCDRTFIAMGFGPAIRGIPLAATAMVAWLLLSRGLGWPARRLGALVGIALGWGYCDFIRIDGVWGDFQAQIDWRWNPTPEDVYLAELKRGEDANRPAAADDKPVELRPGDWPAFRGPGRDGKLTGLKVATDWKQSPPKELWRHRIGPGWSSFAVVGDRIYTQEQRGDNEAVVCYDAASGRERWVHSDATRFEETAAGPGPRSTPAFAGGWLYALGAKGILNCLDPATGKVRWSRDIQADSGAKVPIWGFSASPLVAQGIVTVFAGGPNGKGVLGYHASSGELAWSAGNGTDGYSSTQLASVGGVEQVLIVANDGMTALEPAGGKVLWNVKWDTDRPPRVAQPALVDGSDLLLATPMKSLRRLHVTHAGDSWGEEQVWESKDIKPYYNDLVIYKDHLYGFDGTFFTCVSLEDGKGKWRARGYGTGQVILLADQGLLLISTEKGEVALVEATPERHKELAKIKAIEGKTWNHPAVAHGKLFIRNGEEVACFQLPEAAAKESPGK